MAKQSQLFVVDPVPEYASESGCIFYARYFWVESDTVDLEQYRPSKYNTLTIGTDDFVATLRSLGCTVTELEKPIFAYDPGEDEDEDEEGEL